MSAAKMTARDAAHLLLSIAATPLRGPSIKEAATYLRINSNLGPSVAIVTSPSGTLNDRTFVLPDTRWRVGRIPFVPLLNLPTVHTAADAIEAVLETINTVGDDHPGEVWDILVTVSDPVPEVEICVSGVSVDGVGFTENHYYSLATPTKIFEPKTERITPYYWRYPIRTGLTQSRTFNLDALHVVAKALQTIKAGE